MNRFEAILVAAQAERERRRAKLAEERAARGPLFDKTALHWVDAEIEAEEQRRFAELREKHRQRTKLPAR
jgi:hypothetical protein